MNFNFTDEQQAAADLARTILGDHTSNEQLRAHEASGEPFDAALWRTLADAQLLGTALPHGHGGMDLGFLALCAVLREVGRAVAPVPAYATLVLGALPIAKFGDTAQHGGLLAGIPSGDVILTAALTEYEARDPLTPSARAVPDGDGFRLSGSKAAVPYAEQASGVLVPARGPDGGVVIGLIDPASDGVALTPQQTSDGQPHAQLDLDGVGVSAEACLTRGADGVHALHWLVSRAVVARCMMQLGVTERALEMTAEYTRNRIQFDRPIGSFQAVHQRAADAYINVEALRLSACEAAWRLSQELPADEHVSVAKFWASEGGSAAAYACQHLHGGIGLDVDYPLHRHFMWAIHLEHELGSARHHLDHLGRAIAADRLPPG